MCVFERRILKQTLTKIPFVVDRAESGPEKALPKLHRRNRSPGRTKQIGGNSIMGWWWCEQGMGPCTPLILECGTRDVCCVVLCIIGLLPCIHSILLIPSGIYLLLYMARPTREGEKKSLGFRFFGVVAGRGAVWEGFNSRGRSLIP